MTQDRPRYGEYATPEEQRLRAGLPPLEEPAAAARAQQAAATPDRAADASGAQASAASTADAADASEADARPARPVDRLITIALLAYGLVNVIATGLAYLDLPVVMNQTMEILGIEGEFTNFEQGKIWGTVAAGVLALGWTVTAMVSVQRLRRRKSSWWVPLVGAVATMTVASLCLTVPMFGDPAFIAHVAELR